MLFSLQVFIILLVTKLAGEYSVRLGQPAVLGKLLSGILIGPAVLGVIERTEVLHELSQVGVLLLMFLAGLETNLDDLHKNRNASVAVAVGGMLVPFAGSYLAARFFGLEPINAVFLGLLLSATSVSISVQTIKELGKLHTRESTTILGAAIVDDILVVAALAILMSVLGGAETPLLLVLGKKAAFFAVIILLGWKVVPWVMKKLAPLRVEEAVISAGLIVCFFFAWLAESLGVAGIIGAFAAGLSISRTDFKEAVEHKLEPIAYAIFVPVFFVSIGLSVSFAGIGGQVWQIVVLSVIAVLTKLVGAGAGARLTGFSRPSAFAVGSGMVSRGEVALILAAIGLETKLLPAGQFTALLIVVIVTTMVTPPMLKRAFAKAL
ncbi:cation:proton antiporter [Brevibacillus thermoruber]|uniref:cation:proton antiporter n=1 Tax=Brevibacillus thermoruber TaxID=33942 RepID=UPI000552720C|nr:cation:proton antiporter [Brevibacillus thermoruber]